MTTEAAVPAPAAVAGSPAVIRSVGKCILLTLVSFGLWSFAWIYHTAKEVSPAAGEESSPALRTFGWVIPIVNYFVLWLSWRDVENFLKKNDSRDFPLVVYFILTILIPFVAIFTYISVQGRLNDGWRKATGGQATDAPLEGIDWVFILLGWVFLALVLIVGVFS